MVVSYWQKGKMHSNGYVSYLPSLIDFPLNDTLRNALATPESTYSGLNDLYTELVNDVLYPNPMNLVVFEGNHDESRLFYGVERRYRFVQNGADLCADDDAAFHNCITGTEVLDD